MKVVVFGKANCTYTKKARQALVEEKLEKISGNYLARCEKKIFTTTLKISKQCIRINQNAGKVLSKFKNRALKTLSQNLKSVSQNP